MYHLPVWQRCSMILLHHSDVALEHEPSAVSALEHCADVVVKVESLSSGQSSDIHGEVKLFFSSSFFGCHLFRPISCGCNSLPPFVVICRALQGYIQFVYIWMLVMSNGCRLWFQVGVGWCSRMEQKVQWARLPSYFTQRRINSNFSELVLSLDKSSPFCVIPSCKSGTYEYAAMECVHLCFNGRIENECSFCFVRGSLVGSEHSAPEFEPTILTLFKQAIISTDVVTILRKPRTPFLFSRIITEMSYF